MNLLIVSLAIHLFACLLSPPIYEQRASVLCQFGANEHFSSHCAKTSYNKIILDISRTQMEYAKTQQVLLELAALENRIHLLSNSLFVYCRDCCFFSGTNISQILSLVISKDLPICLHLFAT